MFRSLGFWVSGGGGMGGCCISCLFIFFVAGFVRVFRRVTVLFEVPILLGVEGGGPRTVRIRLLGSILEIHKAFFRV